MNITEFMKESLAYCGIEYDMDDMTDEERREFLKEWATDAYHVHGFDWCNDVAYDNALFDKLILDVTDDHSLFCYIEQYNDDPDEIIKIYNEITTD